MDKNKINVVKFRNAFMHQDWAGVLEAGEEISEQEADQEIYYGISYAATQLHQHDLALKYANKNVVLKVDPQSISRLIAANAYAGKLESAISAWEQYRNSINLDDCEPYVIANLMHCYSAMDRKDDAANLLSFVDSNKNKELLELMYFNAACICSLTDDMERGLRYLWQAIKNRYSWKKAEKDSDVQKLLGHPDAAYILKSKRGSLTDHIAMGYKNESVDIRITGKTILVINYDANREYSGEKIDYKNNYAAIRTYSQKIEELKGNDWIVIKSSSIEIIKAAFKSVLGDLLKMQNNAQFGEFGVLLCEWDYADEDYERNYWFGVYKHKNEEAHEMRHRYAEMIFSDDVIVEHTVTSLPVFDCNIFREIVDSLAAEKSFTEIKKEKPFFFVLQEHDSGHECLVEIPLDYNFDAFEERWSPDVPDAVEDALQYLVKLDGFGGSGDFIDRLAELRFTKQHISYIEELIRKDNPYLQEAAVELAVAAARDCEAYSDLSVSINSLLAGEPLDPWVARAIIGFVAALPQSEEALEILQLLESLTQYAYDDEPIKRTSSSQLLENLAKEPIKQTSFSDSIIMRNMAISPQRDARALLEQEVLTGDDTLRIKTVLPYLERFYKTSGITETIARIKKNNVV